MRIYSAIHLTISLDRRFFFGFPMLRSLADGPIALSTLTVFIPGTVTIRLRPHVTEDFDARLGGLGGRASG